MPSSWWRVGGAYGRIPLQRSQSWVDPAASLIASPVHSTMSSIQRLRCRPRLLLPGVNPWINSFSSLAHPVKYYKSEIHDDSSQKVTLPEHRKCNCAGASQFHKITERWRLHGRVRPTFPTYDVTCQLTYFRGIAELAVFRWDESWRVSFRHCHTASSVFHHLSEHKHRTHESTTDNTLH